MPHYDNKLLGNIQVRQAIQANNVKLVSLRVVALACLDTQEGT